MIRNLIGQELARQFTKHVTARAYNAYARRLDRLTGVSKRSSGMPGRTLGKGRWNVKSRRMRPRRRFKRRNYKRRGRGVSAKYVQRVANRGAERLHISYNLENPVNPIIEDAENPGRDKSFNSSFKMITRAYNLRKNGTGTQIGDNGGTEVPYSWGHDQTPGFSGDYVFYQKTRGVIEVGLKQLNREKTAEGAGALVLDEYCPWIIRVLCVTPKCDGDFEETGFRSLNGDKMGVNKYLSYATPSAAEPARFDCQQLIKNGIVNKADFYVHMDTRFELGAGNVAQTVSKKIPFNFRLNRNVKYESVNIDTSNRIYNPSDLDEGSRIKRKFDKQWFIYCCPSVYNAETDLFNLSDPPINVTIHGVTLALD